MKIIVLGITDYQEKDFIISAISENGPVSFKVRGGLNPNSPFVWLKNPLVEAEVEYVENVRYRHQILKGASIIASPFPKTPDLKSMQAIGLALEIVNKMFQEDEKHMMFYELENYIAAIKKLKDYTLAELILIANAIKLTGSSLEANKCVYCGKIKGIVAFSFSDGGFVCKDCVDKDTPCDLNASQMKIIGYIFRTTEYDQVDSDSLPYEDLKILFAKLNDYIFDSIGVKLEIIPNIINLI